MTLLAFLAAPAPLTEAGALPTFKPRWWYSQSRLDARPVIWSLDNRPEDWEIHNRGDSLEKLFHTPSGHWLWSANDSTKGKLRANDCSCDRRAWQLFQSWPVCRAIDRWKAGLPVDPTLAEQFAAHFIR